MIAADRLTKNEREVLLRALDRERNAQRKRSFPTQSAIVRGDAQWRLVVIAQLQDELSR